MPMHTLQSTSFRLPAKCHYHNHKSGDLQLTTAAVLRTHRVMTGERLDLNLPSMRRNHNILGFTPGVAIGFYKG
jgi:hypothetical protein